MNGDFTRMTFDGKKHYNRVLMQQGRVQLDADWNEQFDISAHRVETETTDAIGACGTPLNQPGFTLIVPDTVGQLPMADQTRLTQLGILPLQTGDFLIGPGRYYVNGKLCENEDYVLYTQQTDMPGDDPTKPPSQPNLEIKPFADDGQYLVYLDVWDRHITALDDDLIREKALGEADTATRAKTVWQVKFNKLDLANYNCATAPHLQDDSTGQLSARAKPTDSPVNDCEVPPGAGYRRLENQLYRVEIHAGGDEKSATFKWSRDNASMVEKWKDKKSNDLIVSSGGPDQVLGFGPNQWIELIDDLHELQGKPGTLMKLTNALGQVLTIDPATATGPVELSYFPLNPKVRRWDTISTNGVRNVNDSDTPDHFIQLEDGVEIKFEKGHYNTGDYWLIPARTATTDVEWPRDNSYNPIPKTKDGIQHHLCNLGLLKFVKASKTLTLTDDCRAKFPALTNLLCLFYVSGDGQEAAPSQKLPHPLQVGVSNGDLPVKDAPVRFSVMKGDGSVSVPQPMKTDQNGLVQCPWTLGSIGDQQVVAELIDSNNQRIHLPVIFNAQFAQGGLEAEPGVHVKEIYFFNGPDFHNDTEVRTDVLINGIVIACDEIISKLSVQSRLTAFGKESPISPTVYVTLDLPYPFNSADMELWGQEVLAFQPVNLSSSITIDGNMIYWKPNPTTASWLSQKLFQCMMDRKLGDRIQAHLSLKGNFIWADQSPNLYLDGEAFGVEDKSPSGELFVNANLTGNQRRGGDCELWFWLTPAQDKKAILLANVKSPALANLSAARRNALASVVNLTLDRASLRNAVPPDYAVNINQIPDLQKAMDLSKKNKLPSLSLNMCTSTLLGTAGTMVADMLKPLHINLIVNPVDSLLEYLQVKIAAGEAPDMVLTEDTLLVQLSTLGYDRQVATL